MQSKNLYHLHIDEYMPRNFDRYICIMNMCNNRFYDRIDPDLAITLNADHIRYTGTHVYVHFVLNV